MPSMSTVMIAGNLIFVIWSFIHEDPHIQIFFCLSCNHLHVYQIWCFYHKMHNMFDIHYNRKAQLLVLARWPFCG